MITKDVYHRALNEAAILAMPHTSPTQLAQDLALFLICEQVNEYYQKLGSKFNLVHNAASPMVAEFEAAWDGREVVCKALCYLGGGKSISGSYNDPFLPMTVVVDYKSSPESTDNALNGVRLSMSETDRRGLITIFQMAHYTVMDFLEEIGGDSITPKPDLKGRMYDINQRDQNMACVTILKYIPADADGRDVMVFYPFVGEKRLVHSGHLVTLNEFVENTIKHRQPPREVEITQTEQDLINRFIKVIFQKGK